MNRGAPARAGAPPRRPCLVGGGRSFYAARRNLTTRQIATVVCIFQGGSMKRSRWLVPVTIPGRAELPDHGWYFRVREEERCGSSPTCTDPAGLGGAGAMVRMVAPESP